MQGGKVCLKCGKPKANSAFYKSTSMYHNDGLVPICKRCVAEECYDAGSGDINLDVFLNILRQFDKPYIPSLVDSAKKEIKKRSDKSGNVKTGFDKVKLLVNLYFKYLTSFNRYKNLTWEDSAVYGESDHKNAMDNRKEQKQTFAVSLYNFLQSQYHLKNEYDQNLLRLYAIFRVEAEQAIADNDMKRFLRCRNIIRFVMNRLAVRRGLDKYEQFYDYFSDWVYDTGQREEVWNSPDDEFEMGTMFDGWDDWKELFDFSLSGRK